MAQRSGPSAVRSKPPESRAKGFSFAELPTGTIEVPDVTRGMYLDQPRNEIPKGAFRKVENGRVRDNWVGRRPGTAEYIAKPDSNIVLAVRVFAGDDYDWLVRVTDSDIHATFDLSGWTQLTGSPTWIGEPRIDSTQFLGRMYLADLGHPIVEVDPRAATYEEIEDAPFAKFVTTFADRVVAADVNPSTGGRSRARVAWSVNGDPTDWSGVGSGIENLVQNPSDFGDAITGIFGLGDRMVILRERTIWHVTRQPIADAPFRFRAVLTGLGCDMPYTGVVTDRNSVIFADRATAGVWEYRPGSQPQRLSGQIDSQLAEDFAAATRFEAVYDPFHREYHLGLSVGSTRWLDKFWVFNLRQQAWSYDTGPESSTIGSGPELTNVTRIDDLSGDIDSQNPSPNGLIDDYAPDFVSRPLVFKGATSGEVAVQSFDHTTDFDGTDFEFVLESQDFGSISRKRSIDQVLGVLIAESGGNVTFELSKDAASWSGLTKSLASQATEQRAGLPNERVTGNELYWRLRTQAETRLLEYFIDISERSKQRQG